MTTATATASDFRPINAAAVLSYFTGKSLEKATPALDLLLKSVAQGFWLHGVSRGVRAALGKANVAMKIAKRDYATLEGAKPKDYFDGEKYGRKAWARELNFGMKFGHCHEVDLAFAGKHCVTAEQKAAFKVAVAWYEVMFPVCDAMRVLDATRPPPVFTSVGVSPTLTRTLRDMGVNAEAGAISVCPIEFEKVTKLDKHGREYFEFLVKMLWPEGTKHNMSRYASACNCHACGHSIRNNFNWVPLVLVTKDGPRSAWVGRDCAKSLFGVDMTGDFELAASERGPAHKAA